MLIQKLPTPWVEKPCSNYNYAQRKSIFDTIQYLETAQGSDVYLDNVID